MTTVAEVIAETLKEYETEKFFCLTGGDHALWIALEAEGIEIINCRSEASAVYMADGYARSTGKPGFVYGQKGPGASNVAAALADPRWANSPVISLTTAISLAVKDRFEYQELDSLAFHAPITKWSKTVLSPEHAGQMLRAAIRVATSAPVGPVHIEFPQDVLISEVKDNQVLRDPSSGTVNSIVADPSREDITSILGYLSSAERPVIIAGGGAVLAKAWPELTAFVEATGIPVATSLNGKGAIDELHPLALGVTGNYSRKVANDTVRDADVILAIGSRLGGSVTNSWSTIGSATKILQIDNCADLIGHNYVPAAAALGDAKRSLSVALEELANLSMPIRPEKWTQKVKADIAAWHAELKSVAAQDPDDGIHPAFIMQQLRSVLEPTDIVAGDTGASAAWTGALYPSAAGRHFFRSAGSLGWVFPGALGVALANPSVRTVAVTGDGGMCYHIGDLETAVRRQIPLVVVVMNNCCFASEYHAQKHKWKHVVNSVVDFVDISYSEIARAFGAYGVRVSNKSEIEPELQKALASGGPAVVEIMISKEVFAPRDGDSERRV